MSAQRLGGGEATWPGGSTPARHWRRLTRRVRDALRSSRGSRWRPDVPEVPPSTRRRTRPPPAQSDTRWVPLRSRRGRIEGAVLLALARLFHDPVFYANVRIASEWGVDPLNDPKVPVDR